MLHRRARNLRDDLMRAKPKLDGRQLRLRAPGLRGITNRGQAGGGGRLLTGRKPHDQPAGQQQGKNALHRGELGTGKLEFNPGKRKAARLTARL